MQAKSQTVDTGTRVTKSAAFRIVVGLMFVALPLLPLLHDAIFMPNLEQREEAGPFPADWFMQQRIWPDENLRIGDYRAAQESAERLQNRSLDEQPPWIQAGPTNVGGRIADVIGHPTNDQILYVASASGGIFKTTDGGANWSAIFDDAPGTSMGALAMDPIDPNVIYAGTGEASSAGFSYFGTGVYRTANAGASWTHLGLEDSRFISRIVMDPEDNQRIWVAAMGELFGPGGQRGVYLSSDGGTTWEQKLFVNDTTGASDIVLNPDNPQIVYAGMWQRHRNPEERRVGGRGTGIYKSEDGGENWIRLSDGLPPQGNDVGRIGLAISQSHPNILYAIYADHPGFFAGVYRTADGGETWARVNDGALSNIYSSFGWYFGNIRVRPDDPDVVFTLGVDLFRTTNGGTTWQEIAWEVHVDHHAMCFGPTTPFRITLGNDGGLYRSANNGNSWNFVDGLPINQFYAANVDPRHPEKLYGGTQDNGTLRTPSGGAGDWERIFGGDGFYVTVDPTDSDIIYAEYQWGNLVRTWDGGMTWDWLLSGIDENERTNWSTPVVMDPNNRFVLYYGAERLYRTENQGNWWEAISPDLTDGGGSGNLSFGTITTIGVSPVNSSVVYAGTDDANVWATVNGGVTWTDRSAGLPNRWITRVTPHPDQEATVYVAISGFRNAENDAHLFRSTDFGANWISISDDLPPGPLNDIVIDPDVAGRLYAASDFGTYVSTDDGETWITLGEDLPRVPVIDLVLHNPSRTLVAATYGRSMFTLELDELNFNRPPEITETSPADVDTVFIPQTIEFSAAASDPDGDTLTYIWTRNGEQVSAESSVMLEFIEIAAESISVVVSDGELTDRHEWNFIAAMPDAADELAALPEDQALLSVYPNPFNSKATIRYHLPKAGELHLAVYDLNGRHVRTIAHSVFPAGSGTFHWDARDLPSGAYFLRYISPYRQLTQKVLLLK